jgi:hypothetical protein
VKSLTELWNCTSKELGVLCHVSTVRDFKTVAGRVEHEGLSFLTISLPNFGKDFEKSLDRGWIGHDLFQGFTFGGGLPRFLGGFLDRVFERSSGRLLDSPCGDSIYAVRQLTLMFGKISVRCSDARERKALRGYIECEQEVRRADRTLTDELIQEFRRLTLLLFGDVLSEVDRKVFDLELLPKHGPGSTADRLSGNRKFDQREWTRRLEIAFPYGEYCMPNWRFNYLLARTDFLEPRDERPVRVILVPKTLKTPRVIAIEPTCMQYAQQAVATSLVECLETDNTVSGMVGFTRQEPNQLMAELSSRDGSLATIDLSEASDRVSNQHVRLLLKHFPNLSEAVDASRSRKADVPGYGVIRLAKFASMGSALCFPVEAMVFTIVTFIGIQRALKRQLSRKELTSYAGKVRVYGDDIIIPADCMSSVIKTLEDFGLKVNKDKSFGTGKFRESCGKEYYDGRDVSITRVRHLLPSSLKESSKVIAVVSLRNRLYEAGLWQTAFWLDAGINPLLGGRYPYVGQDSPVLGRVSFLGYDVERLHPDTHGPQVKGHVVKSKPRPSRASGEGSLLKYFLKRGDKPFADREHLLYSGRPDSVLTKVRWARSA